MGTKILKILYGLLLKTFIAANRSVLSRTIFKQCFDVSCYCISLVVRGLIITLDLDRKAYNKYSMNQSQMLGMLTSQIWTIN